MSKSKDSFYTMYVLAKEKYHVSKLVSRKKENNVLCGGGGGGV